MARESSPSAKKVQAIFSPNTVEEWLDQAGAPRPWARPERLEDCVALLSSIQEVRNGVPELEEHFKRMKRAQKSIDELKRVLPDLISFHFAQAQSRSFLGPNSQALDEQRASSFSVMLAALVDVDVGATNQVQKLISGWHMAAYAIFTSYKSIVGSGSHSRRGPASRFIQLALEKIGCGKRDLAAIEVALSSTAPQKSGNRHRGRKKLLLNIWPATKV